MLHDEGSKNYSFGSVRLAIDKRISDFFSMNVDPTEEIELLYQVREKIRAFEHLQKRWLSGSGFLADYYKIDLLEEATEKEKKFRTINQEQLILEYIKSTQESSKFAIIMAEQMLHLLNDKKNQTLLEPNLFKEIEMGIKGAKEAATSTLEKASALTIDKILSKPIYKFANLLGGRFIYSLQSLDPIHGTDRLGFCYGYVMDWKNEIENSGKYSSQPRSTKKTLQEQRYQEDEPFLILLCKSQREIWQNIDTLLSQMNTSHIYKLGLHSSQGKHAIGLRKCTNGEIEFFDPNFGLFVFPNTNTFRIWSNELFFEYPKHKDNIMLKLSIIGAQPLNAVPSIPEFSDSASNEDRYEYITYQNNQQYLKTKNKTSTQLNLKKCVKAINNINKINVDLDEIQIYPTYDNSFIKKKIMAEITYEIARLESIIFGENQKKIMALKELALRIANANPSLTLIGTIEAWLAATPIDSTETHESIIKSQRIFGSGKPTSASFIDKLVTNYEINEKCLAAMQTSILNHILSIVYTIKKMNHPNYTFPLFKEISNECMKNNIYTQDLLRIIKKCTEDPIGLFAKSPKNEDQNILKLYKLIKNVDLDDPASLTQSSLSLGKLFKEVEKEFLIKVQKQKKTTPH